MQRQSRQGYIRKIDFVFYNEREIRRGVMEIREDPAPSQKTSVKVLAFSDPTSMSAIRNATPIEKIVFGDHVLENPEKWLNVIDRTYSWADELTKSIARERYKGADYRQTCMRNNCSERVYYLRLERFRNRAALIAVSLKLITL